MIEAINSVVSNAPVLRQTVQPTGTDSALILRGSRVSDAPEVPYIDQIEVNTDYDKAVINVRDSETGDVLEQFPSETALEARQRAEAVRERAQTLQRAQSLQQSRQTLDAPSGAAGASSSEGSLPSTAVSTGAVNEPSPLPVAIAQNSPLPSPSVGGPGEAQAAIAALSTGAQSGQSSVTTSVDVSA